MLPPLLKTKLYIPPPPLDLVARPRLTDRLGTDVTRKLTLISAPAGFGKTTLLSEWVQTLNQATPPIAIVWLTLDDGDNDPARFLAYLIAALQTVPQFDQTRVGESALVTLQSAAASGRLKAEPNTLLTGLINEIVDATPGPLLIVFDDYHVISEQQIHDAVAFLLDHQPPQMHLIIGTRGDPPLPLARMRARRQLLELRQADLAFTVEEVASFFDLATDLHLSQDGVTTLAKRTEGWIAGLQMASLALSAAHGPLTPDQFIEEFTGTDRYILDYLLEEVFRTQPDHIQTFLLKTSILDRFTAPLCRALTGGEDPQEELEYLERANLFITPLDNSREWYRYHRLFADLLRKRLPQKIGSNSPAPLHRRASRWYEENGFTAEAIEHALMASDFERATDLIEASAEAALMRSEIVTLSRWMTQLPDDLMRARPRLNAYYAGTFLLTGQPLEIVEERLRQVTHTDADGLATGVVALFGAMLATFHADAVRSSELARQALDCLPTENVYLRTLAANNLGITYLMRGDYDAAAQAFDEVVKNSQQAGNPLIAVGPLSNLAGLYMMRGQLHKAAELYRRALELATDQQGQPLPVAGRALLGLGELYREWNDLDRATRYLTRGIELTRQYLEVGTIIGYISLAFIKQAQGASYAASDHLRKAERLALDFDASELDDLFVAAFQARLAIAQGDLSKAERWVAERGLDRKSEPAPEEPTFYDMREIERVTLARLYVAQKRADEALALLDPTLKEAEKLKRMRRVIEVMALQAIAQEAQGETEQALGVLEKALCLAEPEGYVRAFLDAGNAMARLLYEAVSRSIVPEYAHRLLAASTAPRAPEPALIDSQPLIEPLSSREREVLGLIAQGLSNREIAVRLHITLSTVKGHTTNIYGKLAVHTRTQAVARARNLGLQ